MERVSRYVFLVVAVLFVVGVMVQVFLAGMVVVARQMGWDPHIGLGHSLAGPLLIMLVSMYLGRMPGAINRLTWLLFANYFIQADVVIFLRLQAPVISALHPVLALIDFALGMTIAQRAWRLIRAPQAQPALQPELQTTAPR